MDSTRWKKLDQLFHAALERAPDRRAAYLIEVCGKDEDLRQELESMLEHHERANSFIESPAYILAADEMARNEPPETLIGKTIGQYEVLGLLGRGGMGVVYLAFDQELHRKVALKFLDDDFFGDPQRVLRFKQEARSASALNHPNILTIHQIGEVEGRQFMATEFVEGKTLRELIKRGGLTLEQSIDIATQIASALSAAHSADIIHRDIKPENVMVRPDGYVKVLDFGLAKLIETATANSQGSTLINTERGTIVGTVQYMSPEQTRGHDLDKRTDIWSLGVVLYEMIALHPPFDGDTKSDVIAAILERDPLPLMNYVTAAPSRLQSFISKTLQKNRDERFQSVSDLLNDLRMLSSALRSDDSAPGSLDRTAFASAPTIRTHPIVSRATRPTSSAEYIVTEIRQHKASAAILSFAILTVLVGVAFWFYKTSNRNRVLANPPSATVTKITANGKVKDAAISPDGKYIAYVLDEGKEGSLWLRQIGTTSDVQIARGDFGRMTFSPDGSYIYYKNFLNELYQLPVLGGPRQRVLEHVYSPISFSPDGKRFTFIRYPGPGLGSLMIANADGTDEQTLATRKMPEWIRSEGPSWSPDGRTIACVVQGKDTHGDYQNLLGIQVDNGTEEIIVSARTFWINKVAWLSDQSGLLAIANDVSSYQQQIWQLSYPGGVVRKITSDLSSYDDLSLTVNSSSLVVVEQKSNLNIYVSAVSDQKRFTQITSVPGDYGDLVWAPNNNLIYSSSTGGKLDIWSIGTEAYNPRQLTLNVGVNYGAALSPDGHSIFFTSTRSGKSSIWRIDADGGNPRQLTYGDDDDRPSCSPDGKWIYYLHTIPYRGDPSMEIPTLWKISIDGGEPVQLSDKLIDAPRVSPDGRFIVCDYNAGPMPGSSRAWKIAVIPTEGGEPVKIFDLPAHPLWDGPSPKWSPDGKSLTFRRRQGGVDNLWTQPLDGSPATQLTQFDSGEIASFAWSSDGRLAISRGNETNDVILLTNFR